MFQSAVFALPEELQSVGEFGVECSLGLSTPLADPRLRQLLLNTTLEIQPASDKQCGAPPRLVSVTRNTSPKLANSQLLR
jgi:hypothetical protein